MPAARLLVYALAAIGGVIGYTPLLSVLLPIKLGAFAPVDRYPLLATCSVAGALAAGVANIAAGVAGDRAVARGGGRRGWMAAGLAATALSFAGIAAAQRAPAILAAVIAFQIAINLLLAQVGALVAEEVPAAQKNTAAALSTLANPLAAAATALVVQATAGEGARLALIAAAVAGCVAPLLLARAPRAGAALPPAAAATPVAARRALLVAWAARLLVQVANSGVGLLLFFFLDRLLVTGGDPDGMIAARGGTPALVAQLLLVSTLVPVPLALLLGRWSDHVGRREVFLAATAMLAAAGLGGMALAEGWMVAAGCYVVFATGVTIFQALNIGHAMLLLPVRGAAGRDLGMLNLANTLPQVIAPLLAWAVATADFTAALCVFALLTLAAAVLPFAWRDPAAAT